jgi:hypothetical protein
MGDLRHWKTLSGDSRRRYNRLRRLACCSEMQSVRIIDSGIVTCSYDPKVFNKSRYRYKYLRQKVAYIIIAVSELGTAIGSRLIRDALL